MSMIYPHWDSENEVLDLSLESFTIREYYDDQDCTKLSTKLLGKYQKTTKSIFKNLSEYEKWMLNNYLESEPITFEGTFGNCINYIKSGAAEVVSEKIDINPDYDPEFWQQEYDAQAEAIAMAEKEGYHIF